MDTTVKINNIWNNKPNVAYNIVVISNANSNANTDMYISYQRI